MIAVYENEVVTGGTLLRLRLAAKRAGISLDDLTLDRFNAYDVELTETAAVALAVELETP